MANGQDERRDAAHRQATDRVHAVAGKSGVDDGRKFARQEGFPLVAAEVRIVALPVGVVTRLPADRQHHVDVLTVEEGFGIGGIGPGALLHTGIEPVEQIVGGP